MCERGIRADEKPITAGKWLTLGSGLRIQLPLCMDTSGTVLSFGRFQAPYKLVSDG
jgi:hypothetical protein